MSSLPEGPINYSIREWRSTLSLFTLVTSSPLDGTT